MISIREGNLEWRGVGHDVPPFLERAARIAVTDDKKQSFWLRELLFRAGVYGLPFRFASLKSKLRKASGCQRIWATNHHERANH